MKTCITPCGLIVRAVVIVLLFAVAHSAGLREHTSLLCSTVQTDTGRAAGTCFAAIYATSYLLAVVIAPVFVIAAALLALWNRGGR